MGSRYQTSTAAIMRLVAAVAIELVIFRSAWRFVLNPSITMLFIAVNLGLFFLLIRPRSLETRIVGMIWGAVAVSVGIKLYDLTFVGPEGILARVAKRILDSWADSLPEPKGGVAAALRYISSQILRWELELLELFGIAVIGAGGWLQNCLHARRDRRPGPHPNGVAALDDRAATPV
jgi:hypothetical protein